MADRETLDPETVEFELHIACRDYFKRNKTNFDVVNPLKDSEDFQESPHTTLATTLMFNVKSRNG